MWISISIVAFLLILSGLFSGSETALTKASRALMHEKERENDNKAKAVNWLLARQEKLIGTILLGNNLVNILATSISTKLMLDMFGAEGVAYATLVMTFLILVFSEIMPKTYAIRHANKVSLFVSYPIKFLVRLFYPIVSFMQAIVSATLTIFRLNKKTKETNEEIKAELRGAISLQDSQGIKQEKAMLKSVLELTDVQVYDVMKHRRNVFSINAEKPVEEIINLVLNSPYSRIPIWKDRPENIIGIIRSKTLLKAVKDNEKDLSSIKIETIASKPWFILETTNLMKQLQAFKKHREHFAVVVDEYGALQGIVTLEDVLEEIVGDINDETDMPSLDETDGIRIRNDGSYVVDGRVTIRDLNRKFEWDLPDDEAATIAGFLIHETERIPEQGQAFEFYGFRFKVISRKRNQISTIKITPITNESLDE